MSIAPIKGKWQNIPALLAHLAEDKTMTGILVFTLHDNGLMRQVSIGTTVKDMAFAGACCLADAAANSEG